MGLRLAGAGAKEVGMGMGTFLQGLLAWGLDAATVTGTGLLACCRGRAALHARVNYCNLSGCRVSNIYLPPAA